MSLWMSVPLQKSLILRSLQRSGHTFEGFNLFCILSISLVMDRSHNVLLQLCIQRAENEAVALGGINDEGHQHMADVCDTQILSLCTTATCQ